jgi:excisionase family DNA binding protein
MGATVIQFPALAAEPYLSKRQLADLLGFSVRWVDYKVREGMPSHRFGKRRRFRLSEVERWLEGR